MTYKLEFLPRARKAWSKLDSVTRSQFQAKLKERLEEPRVPKDALHFKPHHYKIKLAGKGYRVIYSVDDRRVVVTMVAVGRRDSIYDQF
jgi:mRNA interferase RelE/StbE